MAIGISVDQSSPCTNGHELPTADFNGWPLHCLISIVISTVVVTVVITMVAISVAVPALVTIVITSSIGTIKR